jgi:hypothetical protein
MAEWFKAAVLKTVDGETRPGVRIPLPPPDFNLRTTGDGPKMAPWKHMQTSVEVQDIVAFAAVSATC